MNVILSPQITDSIREKYILLELDSFRVRPDEIPVTAYALVEQLTLGEMMMMQQYLDLHENLMPAYRKRNWDYVQQSIEHLHGRWDKQLDSFYEEILDRVKQLRALVLDDAWDGVIDKT